MNKKFWVDELKDREVYCWLDAGRTCSPDCKAFTLNNDNCILLEFLSSIKKEFFFMGQKRNS